MATLLEELRSLLPELLPATPEEALMGTELVQRITQRLPGRKESSVRQYLSALAKDPTSPIARVDGGYGYYRRSDSAVPEPAPVTPMSAPDPRHTTEGPGVQARDHQREERFRAFVFRNALYEDRFPFIVEHTRGSRGDAGANRWKYPDLVVADWDVGEPDPTGFRLDKSLLEVKRGLGEQPFRLTSMELKTELTLTKVRESFFQCVSNSKWAHHAELAIAEPLTDAVLTEELRRLGAAYGVRHDVRLSGPHLGHPAGGRRAAPHAG